MQGSSNLAFVRTMTLMKYTNGGLRNKHRQATRFCWTCGKEGEAWKYTFRPIHRAVQIWLILQDGEVIHQASGPRSQEQLSELMRGIIQPV